MNIILFLIFSAILGAEVTFTIRCLFYSVMKMDKFNFIALILSVINLFCGFYFMLLSHLLISTYFLFYYFDDIKKYYELISEMNQIMNNMNNSNIIPQTDEEKMKMETTNRIFSKLESFKYYLNYGHNTVSQFRDYSINKYNDYHQKYDGTQIMSLFKYIESFINILNTIIFNNIICVAKSIYKINYVKTTLNEYTDYFMFIKNNQNEQNNLNNNNQNAIINTKNVSEYNFNMNINDQQNITDIDDMANMLNMLKAIESMTVNMPENIKNNKTKTGQKMNARQLRRKKY